MIFRGKFVQTIGTQTSFMIFRNILEFVQIKLNLSALTLGVIISFTLNLCFTTFARYYFMFCVLHFITKKALSKVLKAFKPKIVYFIYDPQERHPSSILQFAPSTATSSTVTASCWIIGSISFTA